MRRVRFRDSAGNVRTGDWNDDQIRFGGDTYSPEDVDVLPPTDAGKVVCVGLNYADRAEETGNAIPEIPRLFIKPPNTLTGHRAVVTAPAGKEQILAGVEMGVVIGDQCRNVPRSQAMDVVAGYTCVNDLANRDDQLAVERTGRPDMVRGKAFDNAAPIGPVVVPPEAVPADAAVELRIDGELAQGSTRDQMIFDVPELVESISAYLTLEPGDVISTGTPPGFAVLSDGDSVAATIEGIGTLRNTIRIPPA